MLPDEEPREEMQAAPRFSNPAANILTDALTADHAVFTGEAAPTGEPAPAVIDSPKPEPEADEVIYEIVDGELREVPR